jgi:Ca2+-binding RTX toxin-like protein
LVGAPAAGAEINFQRVDIPMPVTPYSVTLADVDGRAGKDIVIALPALGSVGVMLNQGDGTFGALKTSTAGPDCAGAIDVAVADVKLPPDGKPDVYVACPPYVVRLTGDGMGGFTNPEPFNLSLAPLTSNPDLITLIRRPDGNPTPLLALQHWTPTGTQLCVSFDPSQPGLSCNATPAGGAMAVGDLNGTAAGVPPDEIVTGEPGDKLGIFGYSPPPLMLGESSRDVSGGFESAAIGDLDGDGDSDLLVGQYVNSLDARVASLHTFMWGTPGLDHVAQTLPSIPGVDDVAITDVDGDGCDDVVAAGGYGRGMIHLGDGAGGFDGGQDLAQIGYLNPARSSRATMAVEDLGGSARPELVILDSVGASVMVYPNHSTPEGAACINAPAVARDDAAVLAQGAGATAIDVLANDSDPDGDPLSIASVTQPAHGAVAIGGGGVTYQSAAGYCNDLAGMPDTFTYTLTGGATATVAVTVQCVLVIPPVFNPPAGPGPPPPPPPPPPPQRTCLAPGTVAHIIGTPGDDVLVGTTARDRLSGRAGDDCLFGRPGDDQLIGGTGADLLDGGGGDDRMNGDAGDDKFRGGNGNDDITPGAGKDTVAAQGGDDVINARDQTKDTIDCGAGRDKVTADRTDAVKNCEFVKRAVRKG